MTLFFIIRHRIEKRRLHHERYLVLFVCVRACVCLCVCWNRSMSGGMYLTRCNAMQFLIGIIKWCVRVHIVYTNESRECPLKNEMHLMQCSSMEMILFYFSLIHFTKREIRITDHYLNISFSFVILSNSLKIFWCNEKYTHKHPRTLKLSPWFVRLSILMDYL